MRTVRSLIEELSKFDPDHVVHAIETPEGSYGQGLVIRPLGTTAWTEGIKSGFIHCSTDRSIIETTLVQDNRKKV